MRQYAEMKAEHPDAVLLFRVGDFYETFGEDAERCAAVLGITLTSRNNGGSDVALAGFPYHSLEVYLPKLIRAGFRVAICEQLEKPSKEKKVLKRGITELLTPGLVHGDNLLDHKRNTYLAALAPDLSGGSHYGLSFIDLSTGEFLSAQGDEAYIDKLLKAFSPAEVVLPKGQLKAWAQRYGEDYYTFPLEDWIFEPTYGRSKLIEHFRVLNLKGFGIEEAEAAQAAAGAILHYLGQARHTQLNHIRTLRRLLPERYLWLDRFTLRNLEILESSYPGGHTLVAVLDASITPMGARLLRQWLSLPLTSRRDLEKRHDYVESFIHDPELLESLQFTLRKVGVPNLFLSPLYHHADWIRLAAKSGAWAFSKHG